MSSTGPVAHPPLAKAATLLIVEGVVLAILGVIGLAAPVLAGLAVAIYVGFLLVVGGIIAVLSAFATKPHVHFWWSLFSGVIAVLVGLIALIYPPAAVVGLTLVIAVWLIIDGFNSFMLARHTHGMHGRAWFWPMLNGVADWILAAFLIFVPPRGAVIALGVIVGAGLLFRGVALVAMGLSLRRKLA